MFMTIAEKLIHQGAKIVRPLTYRKEREKLSGAMWSGDLVVQYKDVICYFKLWTHFQEERDMTEKEVFEHIGLDGVRMLNHEDTSGEHASIFKDMQKGVFYDNHRHLVVVRDKILLHRFSWPIDSELDKLVISKRFICRYPLDDETAESVEKDLLGAGFEVVVDCDSLEVAH